MSEQWEPQWIPYSPQPEGWRDRLRSALERYFPVALGLFVLALLGALFFTLREPDGTTLDPEELEALTRARQQTGSGAEGGQQVGAAALSITTQPSGATVLVDQDTVGVTPLERYELPAGVYLLSVRKENYASVDTVVALRENQAPALTMALNQRGGAAEEAEPPPAQPEATDETLAEERTEPPAEVPDEEVAAAQEAPEDQEEAVGSLRFTSEPAGASVWLDGEEVGETPLVVRGLPAGLHTALFRMEGYEEHSAQVDVQPQQTSQAHAALEQRFGTLRVLALPWGSIYIDGSLHKQNTDVWYTTQLAPGSHQITVVHPSLGRHEQEVQLEGGQQQSIVIDLTPGEGAVQGGENDTLADRKSLERQQ